MKRFSMEEGAASDHSETVSLVNNNNNENIDEKEKKTGGATGML